jgi:hypothetical protein
MSDQIDLKRFQRFPVIYPAKAQFKLGTVEGAGSGAVAKLNFSLNNNPHEITGLRVYNTYEIPEEFYSQEGLAFLNRIDSEQTLTMRMAQQNVVLEDTLQRLTQGEGGIHWHPFELPYPFRGGNSITVDVKRVTGYRLPGPDNVTIDAVTVNAAIVGWMYVGAMVESGPPSTGFNDWPAGG